MNEYPFYLFCPKCGNSPSIKLLKHNEIISMSCFKCNINMNERIENIVNYSSKWVTKDIKFCDLEHKEKIPANTYCKNHNLFLCKDCLKLHKETNSQKNQVMPFLFKNEIIGDLIKPTSNDIINVIFDLGFGSRAILNISNKTPVVKTLKILMEKINLPDNYIDQIIFLYNGCKLDVKSKESLLKFGIKNESEIIMIFLTDPSDISDTHEFIHLYMLNKN